MWQWSTRGLSRILEMLPKTATTCVIVQWLKQLTQEAEVEPSASSLEFFPIIEVKTRLRLSSALPSPLLSEYYWMVILSGVWRGVKNKKGPSFVSCDRDPSEVMEESWVSAGLPGQGQLFWRSFFLDSTKSHGGKSSLFCSSGPDACWGILWFPVCPCWSPPVRLSKPHMSSSPSPRGILGATCITLMFSYGSSWGNTAWKHKIITGGKDL